MTTKATVTQTSRQLILNHWNIELHAAIVIQGGIYCSHASAEYNEESNLLWHFNNFKLQVQF